VVPVFLFLGLISGFSAVLTIWEPGGILLGRAIGWIWIHVWHSLIRMRWIKDMFAFGLAMLLIYQTIGGTIEGLILGVLLGVMCGPFNGLVDELVSGLSSRELERHPNIRPNHGIRRSGYNSILIGLTFGLVGGFLFGLVGGLLGFITGLGNNSTVIYGDMRSGMQLFGVLGGIISGLTAGLLNGGIAYLQHRTLRLLLWIIDATPRHYVRFLDYAHGRILLRKIGGGYTFHLQLLNYFATCVPEGQKRSPKQGIRLQLLLIGLAITIIVGITGFVGYNLVAPIVANPYPSYLPGSGTLFIDDSLSQPNFWREWSACHFSHGAFHIYSSKPLTFSYCTTNNLAFTNIAFEVQMTISKGDCGGMTLRGNNITGQKYLLLVHNQATFLGINR